MNAQPSWEQSLIGDDESLHTLRLPVAVLFTAPSAERRDELAWEAMKSYAKDRPTKLNAQGNLRYFITSAGSQMHFLHLESIDDPALALIGEVQTMHRIVAEDLTAESGESTMLVNALLALLDDANLERHQDRCLRGAVVVESALWLTFRDWPNAIVLRSSDKWDFSEELLELARP